MVLSFFATVPFLQEVERFPLLHQSYLDITLIDFNISLFLAYFFHELHLFFM